MFVVKSWGLTDLWSQGSKSWETGFLRSEGPHCCGWRWISWAVRTLWYLEMTRYSTRILIVNPSFRRLWNVDLGWRAHTISGPKGRRRLPFAYALSVSELIAARQPAFRGSSRRPKQSTWAKNPRVRHFLLTRHLIALHNMSPVCSRLICRTTCH